MNNVIRKILVITIVLSTFIYADNCNDDLCLSIGSVSDIENTLEILYIANIDNISNIQFDVSSLPISSVSGGQAESDGFTFNNSNSSVIAINLSGGTLSQGSGVFAYINYTAFSGGQVCLENIVAAIGNLGNEAVSSGDCQVLDASDSCDGIYDCAGVCNGDAIFDECGVCGGNSTLCSGGNVDIAISATQEQLANNQFDVNITNDVNLSGLQFNITGAEVTEVTSNDITWPYLEGNNSTIIGAAMGSSLPPGSHTLTVTFENDNSNQICIDSDSIIEFATGGSGVANYTIITQCTQNLNYTDCNGDIAGDAYIDECDFCVGGNTGLTAGVQQECGCGAPGTLGFPDGACDCDGNEADACGECGGNGLSPDGDAWDCGCTDMAEGACNCAGDVLDCSDVCGGSNIPDCNDVCGGFAEDLGCGCGQPGPSGCDNQCGSTAAIDCSDVCGGIAEYDECGICDDDASNDCIQDCSGVWGGDAEFDCNGECGGDAFYDNCSNCINDTTEACSITVNAGDDQVHTIEHDSNMYTNFTTITLDLDPGAVSGNIGDYYCSWSIEPSSDRDAMLGCEVTQVLVAADYTYIVSVTDSENNTAYDTLNITIHPEQNETPTIVYSPLYETGFEQNDDGSFSSVIVSENHSGVYTNDVSLVTLNACGSYDEDDENISYAWSFLSVDGQEPTGCSNNTCEFSCDLGIGEYSLELTVTDPYFTDTTEVFDFEVDIENNVPLVNLVTGDTDQIEHDCDPTNDRVNLTLSAELEDKDGDIIHYAFVPVGTSPDAGFFGNDEHPVACVGYATPELNIDSGEETYIVDVECSVSASETTNYVLYVEDYIQRADEVLSNNQFAVETPADSGTLTATVLSAENHSPQIAAFSPEQLIFESSRECDGLTDVTFNADVFDADGDELHYVWTLAGEELNDHCTTADCSIQLSHGVSNLSLEVFDCYDTQAQTSSGTLDLEATVNFENIQHDVDAGGDFVVYGDCNTNEATMSLLGSASDIEGDQVDTWEWSKSVGGNFVVVGDQQSYSELLEGEGENDELNTFRLTVTDCFGEESQDTILVTWRPYQPGNINLGAYEDDIISTVDHDDSDGYLGTQTVTMGVASDPNLTYFWMQTSGPICTIEDFQASMTEVTCSPSLDIGFKLTATNTCGDAAFADFAVKIYPEVNHVAEVEHIHDYEVDSPNNCNADDFEATHTICADISDEEGDSLIFSWSASEDVLPFSSKCFDYIQLEEEVEFTYIATDLYSASVEDNFSVKLKEESSDPLISYSVTSVDGNNYEGDSNTFSIAHDDDPLTDNLDLGLIFEGVDADGCEVTFSFSEDSNNYNEIDELITLCSDKESDVECEYQGYDGFEIKGLQYSEESHQYILKAENVYGDTTDIHLEFYVNEEPNEEPEAIFTALDEDGLIVSSLQVERNPDDGYVGEVTFDLDGTDSQAGSSDAEAFDDLAVFNWNIESVWYQNLVTFETDTLYSADTLPCSLSSIDEEDTQIACGFDDDDNSGNCLNVLVSLTVQDNYYNDTTMVDEDRDGEHESFMVLKVYPENNLVPVANAGGPYLKQLDHGTDLTYIELSGSSSYDPDDNPDAGSYDEISYSWTDLDSTELSDLETFTVENLPEGTHNFTLTVTDAYGEKDHDDFSVSILAADNASPVALLDMDNTHAHSSHDGNPNLNIELDLDATSSYDPDTENNSEIVSYVWWDGNVRLTNIEDDQHINAYQTHLVDKNSDNGEYRLELTLIIEDLYEGKDTLFQVFNLVEENDSPQVMENLDSGSEEWTHDGVPGGDISCPNCFTDEDELDVLECKWFDSNGLMISTDCNGVDSVGVDEDGLPLDQETFTMEVEDPYGATASRTITWYFNEPNQRPTVDSVDSLVTTPITPDGVIGGEAVVELRAVGSDSDYIDELTYCWFGGDLTDRDHDCTEGDTLAVSLAAGTHEFSVIVEDSYGAKSDPELLVVTVEEFNLDPEPELTADSPWSDDLFHANHDGDPETDTATFLLDASASDDGDATYYDDYNNELEEILTFVYNQISGPSNVTFSPDENGDSCTVSGALPGDYEFEVVVYDGYMSHVATTKSVEVVEALNAPPVADVMVGDESEYDLHVPHDGDSETGLVTVSLDASESDNEDNNSEGDELEFEWSLNDVLLSEDMVFNYEFDSGAFDNCFDDTLTFGLKVTDKYNDYDTSELSVNLFCEENHAPEVFAGGEDTEGSIDIEVEHDGDPFTNTVDYTITDFSYSDEDGDSLNCIWSQDDDDSHQLAQPISESNTYQAGVYNLILECDDEYKKVSDTVEIKVEGESNYAPVADAGDDQFHNLGDNCSIDPNLQSISLSAVDSYDNDDDDLYYTWTDQNGYQLCNLVACDIELGDGDYTITLSVTDLYYEGVDTDTVSITVQEEAEAEPIADAGDNQNVTTPYDCDDETNEVTITLDGSASYDPNECAIEYKWRNGNGDLICEEAVCDVELNGEEPPSTFTLTVENGNELPHSSDVTYTILPESAEYSVIASAENPLDTEVACDGDPITDTQPVVLDGCDSSDPNQTSYVGDRDPGEGGPGGGPGGGDGDGDGDPQCELEYTWTFNGVDYDGCEVTVDASAGDHSATLKVSNYLVDSNDDPNNTDNVTVYFHVDEEDCNAPVAQAGLDHDYTLEMDCHEDGDYEDISLEGSCGESIGITNEYWTLCEGGQLFELTEDNYQEDGSILVDLPEGEFCFEYVCVDGFGNVGKDQINVTINEEDSDVPTANAGEDAYVYLEHDDQYGGTQNLTLQGSATDDCLDELSYFWYDDQGVQINSVTEDLSYFDTTVTLASDDGDITEPVCFTLQTVDVYGNESIADEVCYTLVESNTAPTAVVEIVEESNMIKNINPVHCSDPFNVEYDIKLTVFDDHIESETEDGFQNVEWSNGDTADSTIFSLEPGGHEISVCMYGNYYGNPGYEDDFSCTSFEVIVAYDLDLPTVDAGSDQEEELAMDCNIYDDVTNIVLDAVASGECTLSYSWSYEQSIEVDTVIPAEECISGIEGGGGSVNCSGIFVQGLGCCVNYEDSNSNGEWDYQSLTETVTETEEIEVCNDEDCNFTVNGEFDNTLTVEVCDFTGNCVSDQMEIEIIYHGDNEYPVPMLAVNNQTIDENLGFINDGSASFDPDGCELSYTWTDIQGNILSENSTYLIENGLNSINNPGFSKHYNLIVTDPYGASSIITKVINVENININPDAVICDFDDYQVPHDGNPETNTALVTLDGSCTSDNDNDELTYLWYDNNVLIEEAIGENTTVSLPSTSLHSIRLEVVDGYNGEDNVSKTLFIQPEPNTSPAADAGLSEIKFENELVVLSGINSQDPDEVDLLDYRWELESILVYEFDGFSISEASNSEPNIEFIAPQLPGNTFSVMDFKLTITDPYGEISTDNVTKVIINDNSPPEIINNGNRSTVFNHSVELEYGDCEYITTYEISQLLTDPDIGDYLNIQWECIDVNGNNIYYLEEILQPQVNGVEANITLSFNQPGIYNCNLIVSDEWNTLDIAEDGYYDESETIILEHIIDVTLPLNSSNESPIAIIDDVDYSITDYSFDEIYIDISLNGCNSYDNDGDDIVYYNWYIDGVELNECTSCLCETSIIKPIEGIDLEFSSQLQIEDCFGFVDNNNYLFNIEINQSPICSQLPEFIPIAIEESVQFKVEEYCYDPNIILDDRIDSCSFTQVTEIEGCTNVEFQLNNECEIEFQLPDVMDNLYQLEEDICFIMDVSDSFDATTQKFLRFKYETCNSDDIPLLHDGNNLVSFSCFPYNTPMEQFFNDNEYINFIISQGLGLFKMDDGTLSGNITEFDYHKGYWINTEDCDEESCEYILNLNAVKVTDNVNYELEGGNNLIGVHGFSETIDEILETFGGEEFASLHFDYIIGQGLGLFFTDVDQDGEKEWSGNLSQLEPYHGYWLQNDSVRTMQFTFPENDESISREFVYQPEILTAFKPNQSMEQSFYLANEISVDGISAQYGDVLLSYNDNVLTGSAVIEDGPTTIAVMGRDMTDLTIGFHEVGQAPQFKIYLQNSGEIVELTSSNNGGWTSMSMHQMDRLMGEMPKVVVSEFSFNTPYPNPFNPVTTFSYGLPNEGKVTVTVYNLNGEKVTELLNENQTSGIYNMDWNAGSVSAGVYFINLEVLELGGDTYQQTQKVILLK